MRLSKRQKQMLLPLLFFFDLDSSEDRSNTYKVKKNDNMQRIPVQLNAPASTVYNIWIYTDTKD